MLLTDTNTFDAYARERGWFYDNGGVYLGEHWDWYTGSTQNPVLMRQAPDRVAIVRYDGLTPTELWSGKVTTDVDFDQALTAAGLSDMQNDAPGAV